MTDIEPYRNAVVELINHPIIAEKMIGRTITKFSAEQVKGRKSQIKLTIETDAPKFGGLLKFSDFQKYAGTVASNLQYVKYPNYDHFDPEFMAGKIEILFNISLGGYGYTLDLVSDDEHLENVNRNRSRKGLPLLSIDSDTKRIQP